LEEVLKNGPWTFDNQLLIMERVQIGVQIENIPLYHSDFWVQIHGLPTGLMKEAVGSQLGSYIGFLMEYDKNNNSCFWREYMRLRIKMDVRVPLKKGTRVKDRNGNWCTVRFKYEKLGIFCFVCGIMGHAENRCETRFAMEVDDGSREWSNDLGAEPRRVAGRPKSRWLVEERGGSRKEGGRVNNGRSQSSGESSNQDPTVFNAPTNAFNDIIIASQNGQDNPLNPSLTSVGQPLCPKNTQSLPNNEMIMTNPAVTSTVSPIPAFKPPFSKIYSLPSSHLLRQPCHIVNLMCQPLNTSDHSRVLSALTFLLSSQ
jgi:14-3-3 protein epsilon